MVYLTPMFTSLIDFIKRPKRFSPVKSTIEFRSRGYPFTFYQATCIWPGLNIMSRQLHSCNSAFNFIIPVSADQLLLWHPQGNHFWIDFEFDQPPPLDIIHISRIIGPWTGTRGDYWSRRSCLLWRTANGNPNGPSALSIFLGIPGNRRRCWALCRIPWPTHRW